MGIGDWGLGCGGLGGGGVGGGGQGRHPAHQDHKPTPQKKV